MDEGGSGSWSRSSESNRHEPCAPGGRRAPGSDQGPEGSRDAWVHRVKVEMVPPSLQDNTADVDRLVKALGRLQRWEEIRIPFSFWSDVPRVLREHQYRVEAVVHWSRGGCRLIELEPLGGGMCGIAVDLGTSTLVLRLVDLSVPETVAETSFTNPQVGFGTDILTRIHEADSPRGLETLRSVLVHGLNERIAALLERSGLSPGQVVAAAVAGNTAMTHFLLGLPPNGLCREPYIPVVNRPGRLTARDLELKINPRAPVWVSPNVGSYFGGDLIAGILASGMHRHVDPSLLVDVGTNAEVVMGNRDWLVACAGAAGPALEGGVARMGMMAGPGVIDRVRYDKSARAFRLRTIGAKPPVGICGSGLIDLAAELFQAGMIDVRGKFVPQVCGERLIEREGIPCVIVVPAEESGTGRALTLSQPDIDALIRSKAAMYTILTTLSRTMNVPLTAIRRFYMAGTFGSYIDARSAVVLGMIPDLPRETYVSLGNTSIEGATLALCSRAAQREAAAVRGRITYLELNVNQEFMNRFSAARFLPHTDRSLFPSVPVP